MTVKHPSNLSVIVHGGAGKLNREGALKKVPYLSLAVERAWDVLVTGKRGEYAVEAALRVMEECEYFNAGFGGYPNIHGIVLLDVGLMNGDRDFISLLNLRKITYPSSVAIDMLGQYKGLMTIWTHELMQGVERASDETKARYGLVKRHEDMIAPYVKELLSKRETVEVSGHGTVGCVVRDSSGNLCAGTSTGGINLKYNGRIGDSPIIGSGVFADNEVCALSTTGHGESFMRSVYSGFVIAELRRQLREDPTVFEKDETLLERLLVEEMGEMARKSEGKGGGIIVIPARGDPAWACNSEMVSIGYRVGTPHAIEKNDAFIALASGEKLREEHE